MATATACKECGQPAQSGYVCDACRTEFLTSLERGAAAREREARRANSAEFRARATALGIVVGARVTRKRAGGNGTVVEVGGNYVRVAWHGVWRQRGDHRTYVRSLTSLAVVTP